MILNKYKHAISSYYDQRARDYDESNWHREVCDSLLSIVPLNPGERVLDVGTGTGYIALEAAQAVQQSGSVIGVDISRQMLALAEKKLVRSQSENIEFQLVDAENLEYPAESFDAILCANTFPWFEDKTKVFRSWFELLRPGGKMGVHMPSDSAYIGHAVMREAFSEFGVFLEYSNRIGPLEKVRSLIHDCGFKSVRIEVKSYGRYVSLESARSHLDALVDGSSAYLVPTQKTFAAPQGVDLARVRLRFNEKLQERSNGQGIWDAMESWFVSARKTGEHNKSRQ